MPGFLKQIAEFLGLCCEKMTGRELWIALLVMTVVYGGLLVWNLLDFQHTWHDWKDVSFSSLILVYYWVAGFRVLWRRKKT